MDPVALRMKNGDLLTGMGMSTGIYHAQRNSVTAKARLNSDGTLLVQCATADTGPGTYTVMTQIAADVLKIPLEKVAFDPGDPLCNSGNRCILQ